jgi:hypothetical protein
VQVNDKIIKGGKVKGGNEKVVHAKVGKEKIV